MPEGTEPPDLDALSIETIRTLCIDAIQAANSGHPGTPMGMAPVAYTLWQRFLRFDPADPIWLNRDRFVLSEGNASALLGSLLHLTQVKEVDPDYELRGRPAVELHDLETFRQLGSRCPRFAEAGIDVAALAAELQTKGAHAFVESWEELLSTIERASSSS